MPTPRSVLFSLCLTFLASWLGLAAQPAAAQQTVTLSGRVTDSAGQAVSGAFVGLYRLPGWIFTDGQDTNSNGAYRFSVPPGTYQLEVRPHGPFIAQRRELALATNTTRNIVLETGVTLSGQVTGPGGQAPPWVYLSVRDDAGREISFAWTDDGHYSLGVPAGTYQLGVVSDAFLDKTLEGVAIPHDTILNITLEAGVLLEGKVVDDGGQPVPDARVCAHLPAEEWWEGFCTDSEFGGSFQLRVAPAEYVVTIRPVLPLRQTRLRLEVSGEGVTGLVLTVSRDSAPFVPDDPPKAALISISPPTADGEVTIRGTAGSVVPNSAVVAFTLETGHFTTAQATSSGGFNATLFAPASTSVLIKADPVGTSVSRFLPTAGGGGEQILLNNGEQGGHLSLLAGLPGTILRVTDPSGAALSIGGAGRIHSESLPAWTFHGSINTQTLTSRAPLRVRGTVQVDSPALQGVDGLRVETALRLERLSDTDGSSILRSSTFASTFLTPTGLPIERQPRWWDAGLSHYRELPLVKTAATQAEAGVDLTLTLPSDLPAGYYRPFLSVFFPDMPAEDPPSRSITLRVHQATRSFSHEARLPIIRVGSPAPPRLHWSLLLDTLSNGSRGVLAGEDADRFGIAQRILTSSKTFVIPRLGTASSQPLTYRLEPFVPTVSLGNGSGAELPAPPLIPFRFPSGSLTVRIRYPDGTERVLGPAPFVQSRLKSLVDDTGGLLDGSGGHISDVYQLTTLDPHFDVAFTQDGLHVITVEGTIDDIWGHTWTGGGTYDVHVGRVLALDTAVLPGTHFEVGDGFNPGLVVSPPMTAEVEVRIQHIPHSDISQLEERVIRGQTNRFGYFQPAGNSVLFDQPSEYRVDITATGQDARGQLWIGSRTWGGVVAPVDPLIVAHGRRGIDAQDTIGPQWFFFDQLPWNGETPHVPFPFQSGDVTWVEEAGDVDSSLPIMTLHDPSRQLTALLRQRGGEYVPLGLGAGSFAERVVVGETPLFSSRPDGDDPHLDPTKVDLWAYSYRSSQRPLVRVREEISEDALPNPYWRFNDRYANQIGVGAHGDLPGEFKFQYGAAVLYGPALDQSHYAIHGSLFVLLPENDPDGTRTFPPFQGNGGGPSGGPLFTLKGEEIDLFIHLTGVRPGSVLETGNTFALVGAVGPTLPAKVAYTVTAPDGSRRTFSEQANTIGYYYEPEDNFIVDQPGRYTVDLQVTYDGRTSAGQVTAPFPQGHVLGTARGRFSVYVVSPHSAPLEVDMSEHDFLTAPADFTVTATAPTGMRLTGGHMTALMPGVVLEDGSLAVEADGLTYDYDPVNLAAGVPMLDVDFFGTPVAADVVTVSLFGEGRDSAGQPSYAARVVTLHGAEFLNLTPVPPDPTAIRDLERLE